MLTLERRKHVKLDYWIKSLVMYHNLIREFSSAHSSLVFKIITCCNFDDSYCTRCPTLRPGMRETNFDTKLNCCTIKTTSRTVKSFLPTANRSATKKMIDRGRIKGSLNGPDWLMNITPWIKIPPSSCFSSPLSLLLLLLLWLWIVVVQHEWIPWARETRTPTHHVVGDGNYIK